ncbi:MAG: hypothetical protein GXY76_08800 [Chloroflexi bacterium]|nr:hypothetical protein [Chloroflexota bacterium]
MEAWVKSAVHDLIDDNSAALVSGLTIQGLSWPEAQLSKERITAAAGRGAFLGLDVPRYWLAEGYTAANLPDQATAETAWAEYEVELEAFWYALPKVGEEQQFEGMGADWDKFIARLARLLYQTTHIRDHAATHTFVLARSRDPMQHRRVNVEVSDLTAGSGAGDRPIWYALLRFTLQQRCVDLAELD